MNRLPPDDTPCLSLLANGEVQDQHALVHQLLAVAYIEARNNPAAEMQIGQALALAPDDWAVHANAGYVNLYLGLFSDAHRHLSQAMQANPDFPLFLLLNRAVASQGLGRFEDAEQDVALYKQYSQPEVVDCASGVTPCTPVPIVGPRRVQ